MEPPLAQERAAEQHVLALLNPDYSLEALLDALNAYRQLFGVCVFADFDHAERHEGRLWGAHTEARKYIHAELSKLRKQGDQAVVQARHVTKLFLRFVKDGERFYRTYISQLNATFGGVPELETVAHKMEETGLSESSPPSVSPVLREKVLMSCHQTLVYLGDLSRWRASAKLDKTPNFGPAIGYYGLACILRPSSGLGHHQQAVIALEQRDHLKAIYHLYRAIVVDDPHPLALNNLKLEFAKTSAAWDKGELIQKGPPNDPEAPRRALLGWFIRLHSVCFKGEQFRGYEELERELRSQMSAELKQERSHGGAFMRMLKVNLAAQYYASENFQKNPILENQQAFMYFFHLNLTTFATLLGLFHDNIKNSDAMGDGDEEPSLSSKLNSISCRLLPGLRLYSSWLLSMMHLIAGLATDDFCKSAIERLWQMYARTIDKIAEVFPIWDLEDIPAVEYMLEEDVDTFAFKPLVSERTLKTWYSKETTEQKLRFSDLGVNRVSASDEMLARVKDLLVDGLFLANDDEQAPIELRGTRITYGNQDAEVALPLPRPSVPVPQQPSAQQVTKTVAVAPKPLSYAAAAISSRGPPPAHIGLPNGPASLSHEREGELSRMVDDLVDDEDGNHPVTPPRQLAGSPAVGTHGELSHNSLRDSAQDLKMVNYSYQPAHIPKLPLSRAAVAQSPPMFRTPENTTATTSADRLQSMSSLWKHSPGRAFPTSPQFPPGLSTGTLTSPGHETVRGHSRVNSASSMHSRTSQKLAGSWSSLASAAAPPPPGPLPGIGPSDSYGHFSGSTMASPLLFGAGGSPWNPGPLEVRRNVSPPNGHGG